MKKIKTGEGVEDKDFDKDFYSRERREFLLEEEEITIEEDGFMFGYEEEFPPLGRLDEEELDWDSGGEPNVA